MTRVLLIVQEVGGVGKSTVTRGLAEAVPDVSILEVEASHRLTELGLTAEPNTPGVRHFPMRASRAEIEASGSASREELDGVVNALYAVAVPTLVDVGANTAASLVDLLEDHAEPLAEGGIELGLVVVVANETAALAAASKLLHTARAWHKHGSGKAEADRAWARSSFIVANAGRGPVDPDVLAKVANGATIEPPRVSRRLQLLRGWSHDEANSPVFP